jgi:ribonucleotide reductase alpha subunit
MKTEFSPFAEAIRTQKYPGGGSTETWPETAHRVAHTVLSAVNATDSLKAKVEQAISDRKFIPGGRYLYATGKRLHQTQNCLLTRAVDSREGWAEHLSNYAMGLMSGAGMGTVYSDLRPEHAAIAGMGGRATGPLALMKMSNECGRGIMQGGSRRAAIWAGLHWNHPDIEKFVVMKNWPQHIKDSKAADFSAYAPMDQTNISVILDDGFFEAYRLTGHKDHSLAHNVYWRVIRQMLETGEPGFSIDCGMNQGENLRNAPVLGETYVLTDRGYRQVNTLVNISCTLWTGQQWAKDVVFTKTSDRAPCVTVKMTGGRELTCDESHPFMVERWEGVGPRRVLAGVERVAARNLTVGDSLMVSLPNPTPSEGMYHIPSYTDGYLYGDGSFTGSAAEVSFCCEDKLACLNVLRKDRGISSVNDSDGRGYARVYFTKDSLRFGTCSKETFPTTMYSACHSFQVSFLAGLFDADGNYDAGQHRVRLSSIHKPFLEGVRRLLEQTGILAGVTPAGPSGFGGSDCWQLVVMSESVQTFANVIPTQRLHVDTAYRSYRPSVIRVVSVTEVTEPKTVYCADVKVPEHTFMAEGVIISNCTEITSFDDSDICNLGSINLARVDSLDEMSELVGIGTAFLMAGTVYSDLPYPKVHAVREKNRRLGLGLMGIHEWLLLRGKPYGPDEDLGDYLDVYTGSDWYAARAAKHWGLSVPVKTRAIAPTGSIGILAETTTGIEPVFCVAYKRRYLDGHTWKYQYVVDPSAAALIERGVRPEAIEDAYVLAKDVERRVAFQAWVQRYVDHGISSTINLPAWGSDLNNPGTVEAFGTMLMKYLSALRGVTVYPDGARSGQPLNPVRYETAMKHSGEVFYEQADICEINRGGSCGA